jgi:pre-mRNA-processing factor 6
VLNRAREAIPTERTTWITAAKLEEAHGNSTLVNKIIEKMVSSLAQYQVVIRRDEWIAEAVEAERSNAMQTCTAIVRNTIALDVDNEDRKSQWMDDVEHCLTLSPIALHTARSISDYALSVFPTKKSLWMQRAMLEKEHASEPQTLETVLKDGVKRCPHAELLWLMAAKEVSISTQLFYYFSR